MRRTYLVFIVAIAVIFTVGVVSATPFSDSVFQSAYVTLTSGKTATFSAETFYDASEIRVSSVKLYKMVGSTWTFIRYLNLPEDVATNDVFFYTSADYSDHIGTGTCRLKVTFTADGHSITRYSNQMTY